MDWLDHMKSAVDYIEDNLNDVIDIDKAAKAACCSPYHFQRLFSFITNVPLAEYIRRRRLTLAAFELQSGNARIIDIALNYGYESQSAFARAFQAMHGVTPTEARRTGVVIKAYPRISFEITVKGAAEMNYKIEKAEAFSLFGIPIDLGSEVSKFTELPKYAEKAVADGTHDKINIAAGKPVGSILHGVHFGFDKDGSSKFMFAWDLPQKPVDQSFTVLRVPALTWAVFTGSGEMPDGTEIQKIWRRLYTEWFPTSGYEQAEGPCIEKYTWLDDIKEKYSLELWIPIVAKKQV